MGHFRLCALMLVEEIIKTLCIQTPIIIQDKQSFRAIVLSCPHYLSRRSKKCRN